MAKSDKLPDLTSKPAVKAGQPADPPRPLDPPPPPEAFDAEPPAVATGTAATPDADEVARLKARIAELEAERDAGSPPARAGGESAPAGRYACSIPGDTTIRPRVVAAVSPADARERYLALSGVVLTSWPVAVAPTDDPVTPDAPPFA